MKSFFLRLGTVIFILVSSYTSAQNYYMRVFMTNGEKNDVLVSDIDSIIFTNNQEFVAHKLDTFELVNSSMNAYLSDVDYSNDPFYSTSHIMEYRRFPVCDLTRPIPTSITWNDIIDYDTIKVTISENLDFSKSWYYYVDPKTSFLEVYNLIPNRKYYWKVEGYEGSIKTIIKSNQFYTKGSRRLLFIPGDYLGNIRDLGGLPCIGGYIKYGKLIRGAEVLRDDGGPYLNISDEGIYELKERIGCTVELDFGDFWQDSPLEGRGFEVFRDHDLYGFYGYDGDLRGLRTIIGRTCLHNCLELVIKKLSEGKAVFFHCSSGADRTGTFAFIIEALCGVSDNDKSKDYELSSLWATWYKEPDCKYTNYLNRFRNTPAVGEYGYKTMIEYINHLFSGDTLNEKVYNMCTESIEKNGLSLSSTQIELLRSILIQKDR